MPKRKLAVEAQEPAERPKRTRTTASDAAQRMVKNTTGKIPPLPTIRSDKTSSSPKDSKAPSSSKGSKTTTRKISPTKIPRRTIVRKKSPPKKSPSKPALKKPIERIIHKPVAIEKLLLDTNSSGEVFVYGTNDAGQLSVEDAATQRRFPNQIHLTAFGNEKIVKVVCGEQWCVVVTESGTAFTWGNNDEGALGTGKNSDDVYKPKPVRGVEGKIVDVSAGCSHSAFLNEAGMVYLTGTIRHLDSQIGLFPDRSELCEFEPCLYHNPRRRDLRNERAVKVSSGQHHLAFLTSGGAVYVMGDPNFGALGAVSSRRLDGDMRYFLKKREVLRLKKPRVVKFSDVWCTPYATFVKSAKEDRWFVCGTNQNSQLGFPRVFANVTTENHNQHNLNNEDPSKHSCTKEVPAEKKPEAPSMALLVTDWAEVAGFCDQKVVKIVGTNIQTLALTEDGRLLACGDKEYLGLSNTLQTGLTCTDVPVELPFTQGGQKVRDIGCSTNNAVVCITEAGEVFVWGSPSSSIVGRSSKDNSSGAVLQATRIQDVCQAPRDVPPKRFEEFRMMQVAVGATHALMIGEAGPV